MKAQRLYPVLIYKKVHSWLVYFCSGSKRGGST